VTEEMTLEMPAAKGPNPRGDFDLFETSGWAISGEVEGMEDDDIMV
jgi:hypothetical protein